MKLLPCWTPGCRGLALLPDGKPYAIGRAPQGIAQRPFTYKCAGCKRTTTLTAVEFNGLAEASLAELRRHGLEDLVTRDLIGAGVTMEQIEQLETSGVDFATLHPTPAERGHEGTA